MPDENKMEVSCVYMYVVYTYYSKESHFYSGYKSPSVLHAKESQSQLPERVWPLNKKAKVRCFFKSLRLRVWGVRVSCRGACGMRTK